MAHFRSASTLVAWYALCVGVVVFLISVGGHVAAQQPKKVTMTAIKEAWQKRQDKVRSARFAWTERQTVTKAHQEQLRARAFDRLKRAAEVTGKKGPEVEGPVVQVQDVAFDCPATLVIDGDKVRFSIEERQFHAFRGEYQSAPYSTGNNGKAATTLRSKGSPYLTHPQALVMPTNHAGWLKEPRTSPLIMTFRPFTPALRYFNMEDFTVTGREMAVAGRPCVELYQAFSKESGMRLWLDSARDFVMVRHLIVEEGSTVQKIDVRYRADQEAGWVPEWWELVVQLKGNRLDYMATGTLTDVQINTKIAPGDLKIEFPPGSRVSDEVANREYVVQKNGRERDIIDGEWQATYEQLMTTGPGGASQDSRRGFGWTLWGGGAAGLGLVLAAVWLWRRRLRGRQ